MNISAPAKISSMGKGCPCCGWGTKEIQKSSEKAEMTSMLRKLLGNDIDGIASELEDFILWEKPDEI
jgi:hypothetical protein